MIRDGGPSVPVRTRVTRKTLLRHLPRGRPRRRNGNVQMAIARTTKDNSRGSTPLPPECRMGEMGHCTHSTCVPTGTRPCGTGGHPQQFQRGPDEGLSATSPGAQSTEGRTLLCSLERHTGSPRACPANVTGSHSRSPSKQHTIPLGTVTIVPTPDERLSCGLPRQRRSVPDRLSKIPVHYTETPSSAVARS